MEYVILKVGLLTYHLIWFIERTVIAGNEVLSNSYNILTFGNCLIFMQLFMLMLVQLLILSAQ